MNDKKISTIKDSYLGLEVKHGFDKFNIGKTNVEIQMRPRTGVGKYTNFSCRVEVIAAPENGKYKVGDHVWCPPKPLVDGANFDGKHIRESLRGKTVYAFRERSILFSGENITEVHATDWVLTRYIPMRVENKGSLFIVKDSIETEAEVVCGIIPKGSVITWLAGNRVELWQNEVQYWAVHKDRITSVDGKPYGEFYDFDDFSDFEMEKSGVTLKGKVGAHIHYGFTPARKHQKIGRLTNPNLEYHGRIAIVTQPKNTPFAHHNEVIHLID